MNFIELKISQNHTILINLETRGVLRIKNDDGFKDIYAKYGPTTLSRALLAAYHIHYGEEIDITQNSLTVELWAHLYPDRIVNTLMGREVFSPFNKFLRRIKHSTKVIDCGEAHLDNNRWLWDFLSHFILF